MRCRDIHDHFVTLGSWVDWDNTTDTFKAGDPDADVRRVAVAWKASFEALKQARNLGAELLITHESISVNAVNGSKEPDAAFALSSEEPKFRWLKDSGLTVYRCHDVWDRFPGEGIRESWRRGLDLDGRIVADDYPLLVTEIETTTAGELARRVLERIACFGQNGVLLSGNPEKRVSRVGTGTGVTTGPPSMIELGADIGICTDDYYLHVRMGVHASELDFPVITVNHGVSEYWGIENLAKYLERTFPDIEVYFLPQRCPYTVIV